MLVRTPAHRQTESLLGYVLRLSEANGYDTPWHVFSHAGIEQNAMLTAGIPVDSLARIVGRNAENLSRIAYCANVNGQREFRLLGNLLGYGLNATPLRLSRPGICPQCIAEHDYIDAFFDLRLAVACPFHKCKLLTHCPSCSKPLTWFRPGLLICKCGTSFTEAATPIVSSELAELMAFIWAVLHHQQKPPTKTQTPWPTRDLLGTPLRALALKLPDLGNFQWRSLGQDPAVATPIELLEAAANVLANWPDGFRAFLNRLSAVGESMQHTFGKRYELFIKRFFSTRPCGKEFGWLRDAFVRYGIENWSEAVLDKKMLRDDLQRRRYVSKRELARQMNVTQATLTNWAKQGRIELKVIKANRQLRYVADTEDSRNQVQKKQTGAVLNAQAAATYLGMPVSVLNHLKTDGVFPIIHQAKQKKGFHQADLDNFKLLLGAAPVTDNQPTSDDTSLVSLARAIGEYHFHGSNNKADFVVAYLSGKVMSAKRHSGDAHDIFFKKSDVQAFVSACRQRSAGGSYTIREAAKLIQCDPSVLPTLLADGHLTAEACRERSRISKASLEEFMKNYASLFEIAKVLNTSYKRMLRLCKANAVPLIHVTRDSGTPRSFVRREHVQVLKDIFMKYSAKKASLFNEKPAVLAVRQYLAKLKTLGDPLPRRGGKPNRQAIAKACGIYRNAFYNQSEIVQLVEIFAANETLIDLSTAVIFPQTGS